ncbi:MAG: alpha-amylase family glycosyl hydrolase [Candidatus Krumholzibacteriales bacterium]
MNKIRKSGVVTSLLILSLVFIYLSCAKAPAETPAAGEQGEVSVTFTFQPERAVSGLYLAGSFNEWQESDIRMEDKDGDGVYQVTIGLEPGEYQYKFVVDGNWIVDPGAESYTDDGYGGKNSVVNVPSGESSMVVGSFEEAVPKEAPASPSGGGKVPVTFMYQPEGGEPAGVYLAGTFNDWSDSATPMTDNDGDGIYSVELKLDPGRYQYKFVVDGSWITDTTAEEFDDDGFGGKNSVLVVEPGDAEEGLVVGMYSGEPGGSAGGPEAVETEKEAGLRKVTFSFQPRISGVQDVFLAGTFNEWKEAKTRMTDDDGDGTYEVTLLLPPGRYQYKFVVDGKWTTDENAEAFADDGFGGRNSVIVVDASYEEVEIEKGDGAMMRSDIPLTVDYSMVNPFSEGKIAFSTRAHIGDVEGVGMIYSVNGSEIKFVDLVQENSDKVFQYYRTVLEIPYSSEVNFSFRYSDAGVHFYAAPGGIEEGRPEMEEMFFYSPDVLEPFFTPDWAKDGVLYQIFPERFRNGDKSNDPDFSEFYYEGVTELPPGGKTNGEYFHLVEQWQNISGLKRSPYRTDGKPDYYSFYGGDIAGVMEKLPYLEELGVTVIYFNPLNQARSNHKYDPVDYLKIDPHFADEETFREFVNQAHQSGIRIIVDLALNHTGNYHFAFLDGREKGRKSKYWDWYEWKRWPLPEGDIPNPSDYYSCWWGFGIHPNLNFDLSRPNEQENNIRDISNAEPNMDLVKYLLEIPVYWMGELGIDGFRLDVPNEVPFWFWEMFRDKVDEVKPDAYLVGEIWGNAMPWLGPDCFHSTMNYKYFRDPVIDFFALRNTSAERFDREIAPGRSIYPIQATRVMMNLFDSHDTRRFVTTAGGHEERLMLAALFQMTYIGIPQIYYGDEVGLRGDKDPDCRRPFPWDWKDNPGRSKIHDFYTRAISIRHRHPALRTGSFTTVLAEGRVYSYLREKDGERVVVVLNNESGGMEIQLPLGEFGFEDGAELIDELNGGAYLVEDGAVVMELDGVSGAVLSPAE